MISHANFSVRAGLVLAGLFTLAGCGGDGDDAPPPLVVPSDSDAGAGSRPQVTLTVSNGEGVDGTIVITLLPEHAPVTVANFLNYVNSGFYAGTVFHRKDAGFVFQGGGYMAPVAANALPEHKATNPPIALEVKVSNVRGTVAMARTSVLNSATSEFFINLADNTFLDYNSGGYAAFGYISDMSLISSMNAAPCVSSQVTNGTNLGCLPVPNIVITSAIQTR